MRQALAAVVVAVLAQSTCADSITLVASRDNTLYQDATGGLSNGSGADIYAGVTLGGGVRRALLRFDLSAIPPGSTIDSARLHLVMNRSATHGADLSLHRVSADWGEGGSNAGERGGIGAPAQPGDATWLHRTFNTLLWTTPGGDFTAAASASAFVEPFGPVQWGPTLLLTADVQFWLNNPSQNFGWLIRSVNETTPSAKRFASRENPIAADRPRLVINFTPPPPCPGQGTGACGPADWNEDGVVDFNDFLEFLNAFNSSDPCADLNADGVVDFNDFLEFLNLFNVGC